MIPLFHYIPMPAPWRIHHGRSHSPQSVTFTRQSPRSVGRSDVSRPMYSTTGGIRRQDWILIHGCWAPSPLLACTRSRAILHLSGTDICADLSVTDSRSRSFNGICVKQKLELVIPEYVAALPRALAPELPQL